MKRFSLFAVVVLAVFGLAGVFSTVTGQPPPARRMGRPPGPPPPPPPAAVEEEEDPPEVVLGERLFVDQRFSSPDGDRALSCRSCHLVDEDKRGMRAYVDFDARSPLPRRKGDPQQVEVRNSPTMLDCCEMPFLHMDGEFTSLEQLVHSSLAGRNMGWLPGEEEKALAHAQKVLLEDKGESENADGTYSEQFHKVYGVDLPKASRQECIDWIAHAMSDYMRSLKTARDSPYDEFIKANQLEASPAQGEKAEFYAARHLRRIAMREQQGSLQMPDGFSPQALAGLKIFFRTASSEGGGSQTGNCVSCHVPPAFSDFKFHNTGISQEEYEVLHGEGSFAKLAIPGKEAARPIEKFRAIPAANAPGQVDLGHWNHADLEHSPLREPGETPEAFLTRMIAAFKTPSLRNLSFTQPFMHTGAFKTVEEAVTQYIGSSDLAKENKLRSGAPELKGINLKATDVKPLAAFLNSLNEKYE